MDIGDGPSTAAVTESLFSLGPLGMGGQSLQSFKDMFAISVRGNVLSEL